MYMNKLYPPWSAMKLYICEQLISTTVCCESSYKACVCVSNVVLVPSLTNTGDKNPFVCITKLIQNLIIDFRRLKSIHLNLANCSQNVCSPHLICTV